jgi:hypothetical protein
MAKFDIDLNSISPLWLVPVAGLAGIVMGASFGRGTFFLTLAGFALLGAVWVLWQSLQSLTGDAPLSLEEALGLGAPSAEEERKVAVLRALKDLEYERAVGKIDEEDFQRLSHKYRQEAKALLAMLDDNLAPARQQAEAQLEERLANVEFEEPEDADDAQADAAETAEPADEGDASEPPSDETKDASEQPADETSDASERANDPVTEGKTVNAAGNSEPGTPADADESDHERDVPTETNESSANAK